MGLTFKGKRKKRKEERKDEGREGVPPIHIGTGYSIAACC